MSARDGGPAFPRPFSKDGDTEAWSQDGMSLRDYFAGHALVALIANEKLRSEIAETKWNLAHHAYKLADSMLEARKR